MVLAESSGWLLQRRGNTKKDKNSGMQEKIREETTTKKR